MKIIRKLTDSEIKASPAIQAMEKGALHPAQSGGFELNQGFIYCGCCDGIREEKHRCFPFYDGQDMSRCKHAPDVSKNSNE